MLGIEILVKNYPPTGFLNGYPNIDIFYFGFCASQNRRREWLSRVRMRYRKAVGECKDIKNDFYTNNSLNDDL
jgi:hypothetical protein